MEVKLVLSSSSPSSSFSSFFYLRCHRLSFLFFFFFAFIYVFFISIIPLLLLSFFLHCRLFVIYVLQFLSIPFLQTLTNAHHRRLYVAFISIASIHWAPTGATTITAVRVRINELSFFFISNRSIKFI